MRETTSVEVMVESLKKLCNVKYGTVIQIELLQGLAVMRSNGVVQIKFSEITGFHLSLGFEFCVKKRA